MSALPSIQLNFKVFGEGYPVVILHGLFGMLDNWQTVARKLADHGFMVYLIDQRDHGKSPFTQQFNYSLLANDLADFMAQNWIHQAHIVGHSMGGKTAMQFAFDHSSSVTKLVVVDICNKKYEGGHDTIFKAIETIDVSMVESRNDIYLHLQSFQLEEVVCQFLLKNLHRNKEGGYEWKMNVKLLKNNYENILKPVGNHSEICRLATLFIRGENSNYIQVSDFEAISYQFPKSRINTIQNAGHWIHADQAVAFVNCLVAFLNEATD